MLSVGCTTVVNRSDVDCIGFIPDSWRIPVPSAPLPVEGVDADAEAKGWQSFGVAQTGQLVKANNRNDDTLHILGECERRHNAAKPRKKFLGIF